MKKLALKLLVIALIISPFMALASGDKSGNPWQKLDADECAEWQIDGDKTCVQDPSDQSGSIFICQVLVVCPPETED